MAIEEAQEERQRTNGRRERSARIALISPRFEVSYWGHEYALGFLDKRAITPVAALPLLAALTPQEHVVTLIDENIESINYDALADMDIIGVTGMSVQRFRMTHILRELKKRGCFTVVGGAWITVQEDYFEDLADVIFVGEAEETWPAFLHDWQVGKWRRRYEQSTKSDMTRVPTPRFDLLKMHDYLYAGIQISRGCPFVCEFCDIIVTFGRLPRIKTSAQVLAELDSLRIQNVKQVFIVDDNLIGNKAVIKVVLRDIIKYQQAHGYPFNFFTEASIDLAEDGELIGLMAEANIEGVFVGIESPNEESLRETKKHHNIRPAAGSLLDRVHKIQRAGIEVTCGMIVGFDHDDATIFQAQQQFLSEAYIPHAMLGLLYATPKTPLYDRLNREGRLDRSDTSEFGTNVIPRNLSRRQLLDGYINTMQSVYEADAYFDRLEALYLRGYLGQGQLGGEKYLKRHPWVRVKYEVMNAIIAVVLMYRLIKNIKEKGLRREYRKRLWRALKADIMPSFVSGYIVNCILHYHYYKLVQGLSSGRFVSTM
ncbi:MAG: B12-binding domain-containing radical SAM protein [candidate division NC10 bacterium]|nr:B12-binding domain-containing radical SAM protein [candidate division NC10 bacterium]